MRVAVCLLSCGRADYTRQTLETLAAHNPQYSTDFVLLHGEDWTAFNGEQNRVLAKEYGFRTVLTPTLRYGVARMTELLFQAAYDAGAQWVLNLQNDWVSDAPIPMDLIAQADTDPDVYCIRLFGQYKERGTRLAGAKHAAKGFKDPAWKAYSDGWQIGDIHWGHPPALTRISEARMLTRDAIAERVSRERSGRIEKLTLRPLTNVMTHIGADQTTMFKL